MADNDLPMGEKLPEFLEHFSTLDVGDVSPTAWVIYKDQSEPIGRTRGQWMKKHGVLPTIKEFSENSYSIHASLTGNDKLKINGEFGRYDQMPPHVFVNNIKLDPQEQRLVDQITNEKEKRSLTWKYQAKKFRAIATEIGLPGDIPKYLGDLEGEDAIYETKGGGVQICTKKYDNQIRAGNGIPSLARWRGDELLEVAWHTKNGNGKYDGKDFAAIQAMLGEGEEFAFRSTTTNRVTGTIQLEYHSKGGAERRWAAQIGEVRESNPHFTSLGVVITDKRGNPSTVMDFAYLKENAYGHEVVQGLLKGGFSENLRVIASGNGRTSVQFAMNKFEKVTKELLKSAGIPESVAHGRPGDFERMAKIGNSLPPVMVKLDEHREGAPIATVDIMAAYKKDEIMIANRDKNGARTGAQRTLGEYEREKRLLPEDAASLLGLEPDVYSRQSARQFEPRTRDAGHSAGF
ncbi:VirE2 family protein [Rhizobium leguminosarum]|uniref:VirE2 family protein n=1 Tax=Rhizobium leguminosarum TaxID=384 RepID=UPI001C96A439|nr:VirE2 family protein [Rhizobium leguminosarum]MBY5775493.1 VirE2 family protein [Rhizobium leguminosarum]